MEEIINAKNPFEENENKRPQFLTVLCILTFIGSGLAILSGSLFVFAYDWIIDIVEQGPMAGQMNFSQTDMIIGVLLSLASLLGAIFMFKTKKIGFFIYAIANAAGAFIPEYSTFTLIFNAIWIGMYAYNYSSLD